MYIDLLKLPKRQMERAIDAVPKTGLEESDDFDVTDDYRFLTFYDEREHWIVTNQLYIEAKGRTEVEYNEFMEMFN